MLALGFLVWKVWHACEKELYGFPSCRGLGLNVTGLRLDDTGASEGVYGRRREGIREAVLEGISAALLAGRAREAWSGPRRLGSADYGGHALSFKYLIDLVYRCPTTLP